MNIEEAFDKNAHKLCRSVFINVRGKKNKMTKAAKFFDKMVDPKYKDYYEKIAKPTCFASVNKNLGKSLKLCKYKVPAEFAQEMRLIFSNCKEYNVGVAVFMEYAENMSKKFEKEWEKALLKLSPEKKKKQKSRSASPSSNSRESSIPLSSASIRPSLVSSVTKIPVTSVVKKVVSQVFKQLEADQAFGQWYKFFYDPVASFFSEDQYKWYTGKIKNPQCFSGVLKRLNGNDGKSYSSTRELFFDILRVFSNCIIYNQQNNYDLTKVAIDMACFVENALQPHFRDAIPESSSFGYHQRLLCRELLHKVNSHEMKGGNGNFYPCTAFNLSMSNFVDMKEYKKVCPRPMCLDDLTAMLYGCRIKSMDQFLELLRLIFQNALQWNNPTIIDGFTVTVLDAARSFLTLLDNELKKMTARREAAIAKDTDAKQNAQNESLHVSRRSSLEEKMSEGSEEAVVEAGSSWSVHGKKWCQDVLDALKKLKVKTMNGNMIQALGPFLYPVSDVVAPGYSSIIKKPMCVEIIEKKLKSKSKNKKNAYKAVEAFIADIQLIIDNCFKYNSDPKRDAQMRAIATAVQVELDSHVKDWKKRESKSITKKRSRSEKEVNRPKKRAKTGSDGGSCSGSGSGSGKRKSSLTVHVDKRNSFSTTSRVNPNQTSIPSSVEDQSVKVLTAADDNSGGSKGKNKGKAKSSKGGSKGKKHLKKISLREPKLDSKMKKTLGPNQKKFERLLNMMWKACDDKSLPSHDSYKNQNVDDDESLVAPFKDFFLRNNAFRFPVLKVLHFLGEEFKSSYLAVIKQPMALSTMKETLYKLPLEDNIFEEGTKKYGVQYSDDDVERFKHDMHLIFENAIKFNTGEMLESVEIREYSQHMLKYFDDLCTELFEAERIMAQPESEEALKLKEEREKREAAIADAEICKQKKSLLGTFLKKNAFSQKIRQKYTEPFLNPVDETQYPDYYVEIKEPMDFQTMKNKRDDDQYRTVSEFSKDFRLIYSNCYIYNRRSPEGVIYKLAQEHEPILEKNWAFLTVEFLHMENLRKLHLTWRRRYDEKREEEIQKEKMLEDAKKREIYEKSVSRDRLQNFQRDKETYEQHQKRMREAEQRRRYLATQSVSLTEQDISTEESRMLKLQLLEQQKLIRKREEAEFLAAEEIIRRARERLRLKQSVEGENAPSAELNQSTNRATTSDTLTENQNVSNSSESVWIDVDHAESTTAAPATTLKPFQPMSLISTVKSKMWNNGSMKRKKMNHEAYGKTSTNVVLLRAKRMKKKKIPMSKQQNVSSCTSTLLSSNIDSESNKSILCSLPLPGKIMLSDDVSKLPMSVKVEPLRLIDLDIQIITLAYQCSDSTATINSSVHPCTFSLNIVQSFENSEKCRKQRFDLNRSFQKVKAMQGSQHQSGVNNDALFLHSDASNLVNMLDVPLKCSEWIWHEDGGLYWCKSTETRGGVKRNILRLLMSTEENKVNITLEFLGSSP
eukprot:g3094.t1